MRMAFTIIDGRFRPHVKLCATFIVSFLWLSIATSAQNSFKDYSDVQTVLASLTDTLPAELKSSDLSARRKAWADWVIGHDRDIRERLVRGDEDTIVNWLLFGSSFTKQPKASEVSPTDGLQQLVSRRTRDLIAALRSSDLSERLVFARRLLLDQGYRFDTVDESARLERHLQAQVRRVVAERQEYAVREEAFTPGDLISQVMVESRLFRDRGLSLDTSILPSFAIEQALETMRDQRLLVPNVVRRVAVIGPGLDFADKNSGYDFYPVQTIQPFISIDSLVRLGLSSGPGEIELTTFDISPRVNNHLLTMRERATTGAPYVLRLPIDISSKWIPSLMSYW